MDVLVALVDAAGEVRTKRDLLDAVWTDLYVGDEVLTTAIWELRRALGDDARSPRYIQTVPRRGYRLLVEPEPVVTPGRERAQVPTGPPPAAPVSSVRRGRRAWPLVVAVLLVVVAGSLALREGLRERDAAAPVRSLVVLPIEALGGDPRDAALADGITDTLITSISGVDGLRVVSRTTAMSYRGASRPLPEIARELDVDAVVEGTLARDGDRLVLNAQLIDARTEGHLWAQTYERRFEQLLDLQVEVARSIGAAVASRLEPPRDASVVPPASGSDPTGEVLLRWRFRTGGEVWSDPVKAGDDVVFGSRDGAVYSVSLADGRERWRARVGEVTADAVVRDGTVFVVARDGVLAALDAGDGVERWRRRLGTSVEGGLVVGEGTVATADEAGLLVVHDATSGRRLWSWSGGEGVSAVAAGGGLLLASRFDGGVSAFDAVDGELLWTATVAEWSQHSAVVAGDRVLVPSPAGWVIALDAADGAEVWRSRVPAPSALAVWRDRILVGGEGEAVRALDRSSGEELWSFAALGAVETPVVVDDTVLAAAHDGNVYALDPWSGRLRWRVEMQTWVTTAPLGVADAVLFGSLDGSLYCLRAPAGGAAPKVVRQSDGFRAAVEARDTRVRNFELIHDDTSRAPARVRWRVRLDGPVSLAPTITHDTVYASGYERLYALSVADGSELWQVRLSGAAGTVPVVADDLVVVGDRGGTVTALSREAGEERWRFRAGGDVLSTPVAADGAFVFGSRDGFLYAVDMETGAERWRRQLDVIHASPVRVGDLVVVPARGDTVWAVAVDEGRVIWSAPTSDWAVADPVVAGDRLVVGSCDGIVQAYDPVDGRELWRADVGGATWFRPAVDAGRLFFGSEDFHIYSLDAATGHELWRRRTGNRLLSSVASWRDMVLAGSYDRQLWAVDAATGAPAWRIRTTGIVGSPSVSGDLLAVGSHDEHLYLVELDP